jgi:hypothetical protein
MYFVVRMDGAHKRGAHPTDSIAKFNGFLGCIPEACLPKGDECIEEKDLTTKYTKVFL